MSIGNLLELIVCTGCKTRVEYHDGPDGYMSCDCWIRTHQDEPMPDKWIEIEDLLINECGGCRKNINERLVFRCADCGLPFHQVCLDQHCKRGNQKQELRSENLFLKGQLATVTLDLIGDAVTKIPCPSCASLRAEVATLKVAKEEAESHAKRLEEYMLKGVAFRDELQARIRQLECQING